MAKSIHHQLPFFNTNQNYQLTLVIPLSCCFLTAPLTNPKRITKSGFGSCSGRFPLLSMSKVSRTTIAVLLEPATGPTRHINIVEGASSCFSENKVSSCCFCLLLALRWFWSPYLVVCSEDCWRTVSSVRACGICGAVSAWRFVCWIEFCLLWDVSFDNRVVMTVDRSVFVMFRSEHCFIKEEC